MTEGLLREVREEAGFDIDESRLILAHAHVWDTHDTSTVFQIYFAEVDDDPEIVLSWEHERYGWLTAEEVLALEIRQPYPGIFQHLDKIGLLV